MDIEQRLNRLECTNRRQRFALVALLAVGAVTVMMGQERAHAGSGQQLYKILPDDGAIEDYFGWAVAMADGIAVVGAHNDDDNGYSAGSAYIFDTASGQQLHKLLADDGATPDLFGVSVAAADGIAVVGAIWNDDGGSNSGSAYLFDANTGAQLYKLLPDDGMAGDEFGSSVAISGGIVIVGASLDDDNGVDSGSAYLFDASTGQQLHKLLAGDGAGADRFGTSVAIADGVAIVGASFSNHHGENSGSAYVFDAGTGQQLFRLLPDDGETGDYFGVSVATANGLAVVGAYQDDDNGDASGSAYIYDIGTGQQLYKLLPDDGASGDGLGVSVSIKGGIVIVGASLDDDNGVDSGSAYLFDASTGQQFYKLIAEDGESSDFFGWTVAIADYGVIVGAYGRDDNGSYSGAAYLFEVTTVDCNGNLIPDSIDLANGTSIDLNGNGVPDECDPDCNENGVPDFFELETGASFDCNMNSILDECDIADGTEEDLNSNTIPDACEVDCNGNGQFDFFDIFIGVSFDCNDTGVPDECEDDCNSNGLADECDLAEGTSLDCDGNGIPDECDLDCNGNSTPDTCDIAGGTSADCNENGVPDECDIEDGSSADQNVNGIPDECECIADIIPNGAVDFSDLVTLLAAWGPCPARCPADIIADGEVGFADLLKLLASWGPCS